MADVIRRCKDCGAALPESAGGSRRYCDACRKLKRKETNRAYNMRRKGTYCERHPVVRYCSVCGKALPARSSANRKYCLACGEKKHLELARERSRRVRAEKPKAKKPAPPPKPAPKEKFPRGEHRKVDKPCKECGTMTYGVDPGKMFCDSCKNRRYGKSSVDTGTQPGIVKPKEKPK
jgi:predicted RNA-binding Zn-ribbon protein involved in translation (DUF1610 family)